MMRKHSAYNLAKSFYCAGAGVARSLKNERNLRIHFFMAAYILYFSRYFDLSRAEYAALIITIGFVIACELMNTAVEACVDLNTLCYNVLAKTAKDAAAGAVFVSAAASVTVGIVLFWQPDILLQIGSDIAARPLLWLFLIAVTVFLVAWPESYPTPEEALKDRKDEKEKTVRKIK